MIPKTELRSKTVEIAARLEQGLAPCELLPEYSGKWNCSERTIERYIALARDMLFDKLKNKENILEVIRAENLADILDKSFLSNLELEGALCQIAEGTYSYNKLVYTKEGPITMECHPTVQEQLKAIQLLLKLRGKLTGINTGWDAPAVNTGVQIVVQNEEEKEMIERARFSTPNS